MKKSGSSDLNWGEVLILVAIGVAIDASFSPWVTYCYLLLLFWSGFM